MEEKVIGNRIVELREGGYTWNQIDELLLLPSELKRDKKGKIVSTCFKMAKKLAIEGAFSKRVIGAYTAIQRVIPIRKFKPIRRLRPCGRS